jgi:DNA-binding response OmpR family regulator
MASALQNVFILVVEDDGLISADLATVFRSEGAHVTAVSALQGALAVIERHRPDVVIVDHRLGTHDASVLCEELDRLDVPYMVYTGLPRISGPCGDAPKLDKPASADELIVAVQDVMAQHR